MAKLISQGSYGCVYYPGYNCEKKQFDEEIGLITKFVINNGFAVNEIYIGTLLKKIANYWLYFLPVIKSCKISIKDFDSREINKCELIEKEGENKRKNRYLTLLIPYLENYTFSSVFLNKDIKLSKNILSLINNYSYLISIINQLNNINVVHFDTHIDNILFDKNNFIPILIDFGLSIPFDQLNIDNISQLKHYFFVYAPDNSLWPIEVHIICYYLEIYKKNIYLNERNINSIINKVLENNTSLNIFSKKFKENYKRKVISYFKKYDGVLFYDFLHDCISFEFYKSWDQYSISILFFGLLRPIFSNGFIKNQYLMQFIQILLININPNPKNRYSGIESKTNINNLITGQDLSEYRS